MRYPRGRGGPEQGRYPGGRAKPEQGRYPEGRAGRSGGQRSGRHLRNAAMKSMRGEKVWS